MQPFKMKKNFRFSYLLIFPGKLHRNFHIEWAWCIPMHCYPFFFTSHWRIIKDLSSSHTSTSPQVLFFVMIVFLKVNSMNLSSSYYFPQSKWPWPKSCKLGSVSISTSPVKFAISKVLHFICKKTESCHLVVGIFKYFICQLRIFVLDFSFGE